MGFPLADGYHVFPPGKLAAVVTWLEMREAPGAGIALPEGTRLARVWKPDVEWYVRLFREIGEPWLWFGRLEMAAAELAQLLAREGVEVYRWEADGETVGLLELDRRAGCEVERLGGGEVEHRVGGEVEIVYFGLLGGWTGRGMGAAFMAEALRVAWAAGTSRVWLHTCTLDHPRALAFYRRCGFVPYQRGLELYDDPRRTGVLPLEAAPQVPIL